MNNRSKLSRALVLDLIAMVILWLIPVPAAAVLLQRIALLLLLAAAIILLYIISRKRETKKHVRITGVEPASQMNPNQYLSKAGPVCPGSDNRYHVDFLLENGLKLTLSLSPKQAGSLSPGMRGTLVHNDAVFISFTPEQ